MGGVESGGIKLMDYLFTDGSIGKTIGNKTPVAIAVAPASHFADKKWRFMSLKEMTKDSTDGTINPVKMKWGKYNTATGLPMYGKRGPTINSDGTYKDIQNSPRFPAGKTRPTGTFSNYNTLFNGWYYFGTNNGTLAAPSPFLDDGTRNPICDREGQILTEVNGDYNTSILKVKDVLYEAAITCSQFAPGVHDGEWYLPAFGEFIYVIAQIEAVNNAINKALLSVPNCAIAIRQQPYWTSTQCGNSSGAVLRCAAYGDLYNPYCHQDNGYVRAFIKIEQQ